MVQRLARDRFRATFSAGTQRWAYQGVAASCQSSGGNAPLLWTKKKEDLSLGSLERPQVSSSSQPQRASSASTVLQRLVRGRFLATVLGRNQRVGLTVAYQRAGLNVLGAATPPRVAFQLDAIRAVVLLDFLHRSRPAGLDRCLSARSSLDSWGTNAFPSHT